LKKDLQLGDVVVADKVYAYESGKAEKEFRPRPKAPWTSYASKQRAEAVARGKNWLKRIKPPSANEPSVYVKPIAAGEKVLDSHESEVFALIKQTYEDSNALGMEDFRFVAAAHANPKVTFAVVRGISDSSKEKGEAEKKNSQEIAGASCCGIRFRDVGWVPGRGGRSGGRQTGSQAPLTRER